MAVIQRSAFRDEGSLFDFYRTTSDSKAPHNAPLLYLIAALNYPRNMRRYSPPRKLVTETQLYMSAQRALMRRAHSISEMKKHLERRAEDKELVPTIIARLRERNYLDDAKYALDYAAQHAKLRRQGRFRITRELRQRGVPDRYIDDALAKVFADTDESALLRTRIERRLSRLRGAPLDQKKTASIYRSLVAAGFSSELIRAELKRATANRPTNDGDPESLPEFDPDAASPETLE